MPTPATTTAKHTHIKHYLADERRSSPTSIRSPQTEKYKYLSGFESTSKNPLLVTETPGKLPQEAKTVEYEFEEYEKQMNQVLKDVLKKQPPEEKNKDQKTLEDDLPETILDMITDFIERMWEG
ncbi:unnamed protein product [Caenorhabditis brenneri]